jgi:hypothetical protein
MRNEDIPRFQTRKPRTPRSISVDQAAATGSEITHFRTPKICFGRQAERTTAGDQQPLAEGSSIPIKMGKIIILSWRMGCPPQFSQYQYVIGNKILRPLFYSPLKTRLGTIWGEHGRLGRRSREIDGCRVEWLFSFTDGIFVRYAPARDQCVLSWAEELCRTGSSSPQRCTDARTSGFGADPLLRRSGCSGCDSARVRVCRSAFKASEVSGMQPARVRPVLSVM